MGSFFSLVLSLFFFFFFFFFFFRGRERETERERERKFTSFFRRREKTFSFSLFPSILAQPLPLSFVLGEKEKKKEKAMSWYQWMLDWLRR